MKQFRGLAASAGIAVGPAFLYTPEDTSGKPVHTPADQATELVRVEQALQEAQKQLGEIYEKARAEVGDEAAAIFLAHQEFLSDPALIDEVKAQIEQHGQSAEAAVETAFEGYAVQLEALEDEYYRERALDLRDVSRRMRRILAGVQDQGTLINLTSPVVIVARDLTPSDTAQMNKRMVLGFCTATGGLTSHTAIIARILGIPAVVGIGEQILQLRPGTTLVVNGDMGSVLADPDEVTLQEYTRRRDVIIEKQAQEKEAAHRLAMTSDGHRVEVVANIADATSAQVALDYGAEGVGLFRTEYLFLNRQSVPTEEEQYKDYRAVADVLRDRPLIIRTLDIGGDKQLPYLHIGQEMNPFLGWRAIRLCLDSPQIFEPQLRAILRASLDRNVHIMFPMVATLEEVRRARQVLERVEVQLAQEGIPFNPDTQIGIMVEIPSAALMADVLAPEVDFFSIGTNDLIQYTLACDRVNEKVAYLYDPLHPAVLRLIRNVIEAAHREGKWVGMCGEMAGDLEAIPLLLGLGLDEFSMNAPAIPAAKALIGSLTLLQAQEIARNALAKRTANEVREYLRSLGLARS
jgi:phosphotransferase system enzyme I (PtsI)